MHPAPLTSPSALPGTSRRRHAVTAAFVVALVVSTPIVAGASPEDPNAGETPTSVPTTIAATSDNVDDPVETPAVTTIPTTVPTTIAPVATIPLETTVTTLPTVTTLSPTTTVAPATTAPAVPAAPAALDMTVYPQQMQHILATIRHQESRGIYTLPPNKGNASGAYQFIESTWGGYAGYQHAYLAPAHIQDQRAAEDVSKFLQQHNNDVSMVPVMWYYPIAARQPELMDQVPKPEHGNVLTIREYQTKWLNTFATISGQVITPTPTPTTNTAAIPEPEPVPAILPGDIDGSAPVVEPGQLSFPVLGPSRIAGPNCSAPPPTVDTDDDADQQGPALEDIRAAGLCDAATPALVFGVKMQPVLAVIDGVVTDVDDRPGSGAPISVTITDRFGTSFTHAGFNDDTPGTDDGAAPDHLRLTALAEVGTVVRAGQVIGFMGDTDPLPTSVRVDVPTDDGTTLDPDAVAPHIRVTAVAVNGVPIQMFQPVVDALFRQSCRVGIGPWSVPEQATQTATVVVETTDDQAQVDSDWIVTSTGQVQAAGWAALVNPSESCPFVPADHFGPGAEGLADPLDHWSDPYELDTGTLVAMSMRDSEIMPVTPLG